MNGLREYFLMTDAAVFFDDSERKQQCSDLYQKEFLLFITILTLRKCHKMIAVVAVHSDSAETSMFR